MTHFATADEPDPAFLDEQLARFEPVVEAARAAHPQLTVHAANSAAALRAPQTRFDMARCGIAVYGLDPFHARSRRARTRAGAAPRVLRRRGQALRRGRQRGLRPHVARGRERPRSAVLPIGYGDGYRRGLSNQADVLIGGRRYPLAGTVSMDNVTVDLGAGHAVGPGTARC